MILKITNCFIPAAITLPFELHYESHQLQKNEPTEEQKIKDAANLAKIVTIQCVVGAIIGGLGLALSYSLPEELTESAMGLIIVVGGAFLNKNVFCASINIGFYVSAVVTTVSAVVLGINGFFLFAVIFGTFGAFSYLISYTSGIELRREVTWEKATSHLQRNLDQLRALAARQEAQEILIQKSSAIAAL